MTMFNKRAELEARLGPSARPERNEPHQAYQSGADAAPETDEEPTAEPIPSVPVDLDLTAPRPASTRPAMRTEGGTILGPDTFFEGTLRAAEPVQVAGTLQGTLEAEGPVVVEAGGRLVARVVAPQLDVAGFLDGRIQCHGRLEVRSTGLVRGKIHVGTLRIEEGALLDGQLQMAGATAATSIGTPEAPLAEAARPRAGRTARAPEPASDDTGHEPATAVS
jgi:cytoskeletal protein CcmA (bactofilin family)